MTAVSPAGTADRTILIALLADMTAHCAERQDAPGLATAAEAPTTPGGRAGPFCLVARRGDVAVGFAPLSDFLPAFDPSRGLLLKDVYVGRAHAAAASARH